MQHATDAGRGNELFTDPGFLVHANAVTLIPTLNLADGQQARLAAAVYRVSAGGHPRRSADQRRDVLAVDAARYGALPLVDGLKWVTRAIAGTMAAPMLGPARGRHRPAPSWVQATASTLSVWR